MSETVRGDLGDSAPSLSIDDYDVLLDVAFAAPGKCLLLETKQQVKARYSGYKQMRLNNLTGIPDAQEAERRVIDAEIDSVCEAYDRVRALPNLAGSVRRYRFTFRVPSVSDVQHAEIDASVPLPLMPASANVSSESSRASADAPADTGASTSPGGTTDPEANLPIRARARFRQWLAARTLISTDYPDFLKGSINPNLLTNKFYHIGRLPNPIGDAVMTAVGARIGFNLDALAFLESWEDGS